MKRKKKFERRHGLDSSKQRQKLLVTRYLKEIQSRCAMWNRDGKEGKVAMPKVIRDLCLRYYRVKDDTTEPDVYQYRYFGENVKSYKRYFDHGLLENIWDFLMEDIKPEYRTPLKCKWARSVRNSRNSV